MAGKQEQSYSKLEDLAQAVFANPFSKQQEAIAAIIGERAKSLSEAVDQIAARLKAQLEAMHGTFNLNLRDVPRERQPLIRRLIQFLVFQRHIAQMDSHIVRQAESPQKTLRSAFAAEIFTDLCGFGLSELESERAVAIFFQLRRGFFLINHYLAGTAPSLIALRAHCWEAIFGWDILAYEKVLWNRMEDFSTLILGETGTGKGSAAAAIGQSGFIPFDRISGDFVENFAAAMLSVNLSQYAESLIESELFGHRKGSFTGAMEAYEGALGKGKKFGAVFLDEIGDISRPVQVKMLRVLQERKYTPVGDHTEKVFSGRIVAATHRNLANLIGSGQFRMDLFYRISTHIVHVPPLRQRLDETAEEMDVLVTSLVNRILGEDDDSAIQRCLEVIAKKCPRDFPWRGNVRELEQYVRQVLLTNTCVPITDASSANMLEDCLMASQPSVETLLSTYMLALHKKHGSYEKVARVLNIDPRTVKKYATDAPG